MSTPIPTPELLQRLAEGAVDRLRPPARAEAVAETLKEISTLPALAGQTCDPDHLRDAFYVLGRPIDGEAPHVAARRKTCAELAESRPLGGSLTGLGMTIAPDALAIWRAIKEIPGEDPRHVQMRETATRELHELQVWHRRA